MLQKTKVLIHYPPDKMSGMVQHLAGFAPQCQFERKSFEDTFTIFHGLWQKGFDSVPEKIRKLSQSSAFILHSYVFYCFLMFSSSSFPVLINHPTQSPELKRNKWLFQADMSKLRLSKERLILSFAPKTWCPSNFPNHQMQPAGATWKVLHVAEESRRALSWEI